MALFTGAIAALTTVFTGWGLGATFAAGAASFLIKTAAQIATSFLVQALMGKQTKAQQKPSAFGITGKMQAGETVPRQFPMGKAMTAGSLAYSTEWGIAGETQNAWNTQVLALSDLPVKGLLAVMVDGVYVTLDATEHPDWGYPVLEYRVSGVDYLWIRFYDGTQTAADPYMVSTVGPQSGQDYESTRVGYGVAYAICHARINETLFSGFPQYRFLLDSVPLYDPSKDTTVGGSGSQRWATPSTWGGDGDYLPAVQAYNIMRGISYDGDWLYGFQGTSEYRLPAAAWISAIEDCRDTVTEDDGAQPRWRAGGLLAVDAECGTAIEQIMAAAAGRIAESGGIYKPTVGVAQTPVVSLTDDDFVTTEEQGLIPFKGLSDIINAVAASYPEPEEGFNMKAAPTLYDAAYETADGGRRLPASLTLANVPYGEQVQRLQLAALNEARKERRHTGTLPPALIGLEPNDVIEWTSARNGYVAKQFRVDAALDRPDAHVTVDLMEVDPTDYDWVTATDYTAQAKTPAAMYRPAELTLSGFAVAQATLDVGGNGSQPGIAFSWTEDNLGDATGIRYQVRLTSSGVVKARGATADIDSETFTIPNAFKASTGYEVRARPLAARKTGWTAWTAITTNSSTLTTGDISGTLAATSVTMSGGGTAQDYAGFATRAAFVTWASSKTPAVGTVIEAGGVSYLYTGSGTVISDLVAYVPYGDVVDDHFNGNLQAMRAYLDGLTNTEHGYVRGSVTHSTPVISDSDRSASISGMTVMSNINELGSATIYSGTGNSKAIASATNANPAVFTSAAHGFVAAERVYAKDVVGGTWDEELNGGPWLIAGVTTDTFTLTNDLGAAFSGIGLGTLTGGTIRNEGAIAGWVLGGSFMQSYAGLAMRTNKAVEHIIWVHAENYVTTSGAEADFSGSLTRFDGVQFAPQTIDVTVAGVLVENHKFASFRDCWWIRGVSGSPGLKLGVAREQSPNTLMAGTSVHTSIDNNFIFANIVLENVESAVIRNSQFDSTSFPVAINYAGDGVAASVGVYGCSFTNDGGADGTGLAAINQAPVIMTSPTLIWTSGWTISESMFRDWPIGVKLESGWASLTANNFRGRQVGDIGVVIGENVAGESIDHTNNFLQMLINGNQGIVDRRYKSVTVTGATQANPVVVTCSGGHHLNAGDRVRLSSIGGMTQINDKEFIVQGVTGTTFQLYSVDDNGATSATVDGTAYTAFAAGGSVMRPYHWHRQVVYGENWALGHGSFVFDLALDRNATLATGANDVLNLDGVVITGGLYEVVYSTTVNMAAITGAVKFSVTVDGNDLPELYSAFEHYGAANTEITHTFRKVVWMDAETLPAGELVRFVIDAPGAITARGKASGANGQTFMQIRRVP